MARKILLADDSVTAQNMGRKILADAGYEVLTVNNGSAALKKIAEAKPELIVLDVYMPGYSGLEVCQRLKEAGETARIPVLLTVGKLEPFKPEEAKRVRADAFIVKPFEASELLSALSKLEDKIVPAREAHKPGRFARANAAIESYDKAVAIEEDGGWKNRIAFPGKKKKDIQEDGDDPAIYNALNKDLRTVVDHKPAAKLQEIPVEPEKVNVEALAPEGLPKDVTPEEIAALAAAAAQIKSNTENKVVEEAAKPALPVEAAAVEPKPAEPQTAEVKAEAAAEVQAPKLVAETAQPIEEPPAPEAVAEHRSEETPQEEPKNQDASPSASPAAVITTIEPEVAKSADTPAPEPVEEPITMAVAAGAEYFSRSARWMAVPVALLPDEASISLEHEMQAAHAAFAAAEAAHSVAPTAVMESEAPAPQAEPVAESPASAEDVAVLTQHSEIAEATKAVASVAAEAVSAAIQELEAAAASLEVQTPHASPAEISAFRDSLPAPEVSSVESPAAPPEPVQAEPIAEIATAPTQEVLKEEPKSESTAVIQSDDKVAETIADLTAQKPEADTLENEDSGDEVESDTNAPTASGQLAPGGNGDMGKKEADIAETTAAAWASWRRIREDSKSKGKPAESDEAAMAVAAGAEKSPETTTSDEESPEIASIVDSVLADLRPKIVEEISRKLGKKK